MHAFVAAHVDPLDGEAREGERGALDGFRRAEIGEDRAMVIDVGMDVEERDTDAFDGIAELPNQRTITALADIRDAFEQRPGRSVD